MRLIKPLSSKQLISYQDSNAKINIWEGAVRSGKTYVSIARFLDELMNGPPGVYCIITRTFDTFKRNILEIISDMIGADAKYYSGKREMNIWGKTIHIIGADDERAESKIRGPTFSGAYVDEATIIPESVFKMLISRCAMGGARIFATTNPDSPYHWLKVNYLENNKDVRSWQFKLSDNPQLTDKEKEYLKRQYRGLWYQRFIEGKWVQAEGAVYGNFTEEDNTIDYPTSSAEYFVVGVDYGTTNPFAAVLLGVNRSTFPNVWVQSELYYDSKLHQRQKTDSEYADDLARFIEHKQVKHIYLDPSAVSFRVELQKRGMQNVFEARNEVRDGIRLVDDFINNGTLKIVKCCKNLISEFQSYVWDDKAALRGEEKPKKESDHCLTKDNLVWTVKGKIPIKNLVGKTGFVECYDFKNKRFTTGVFKNVRKTREKQLIYKLTLENGHTVRATGDHKVWTKRGYVEIQCLLLDDEILCYA